jgi:hypothetical protein
VPVISGGGGGGGNTTAQVAASGKVLPVADATGVTVDTTTYDDTIKGSGKLTTLVFPAAQGAVAFAIAGDAFPRWLLASDDTYGILFGDGTSDPVNNNSVMAYLDNNTVQTGRIRVSAAGNGGDAPRISQLSPLFAITNGVLPTVQLVTATGAQILTTRDAETITPCTFNPGAATTATVTVALSPDNVTYSTLGIETEPAGVAFDGTIHLVKVRVPAGWYLKLTVNAQAVLGLTTYY